MSLTHPTALSGPLRPHYGAGIEFPHDFDGEAERTEALRQLRLVEIIPEGFFHGKRSELLRSLALSGVPVVVHSIDMSLGTDGPFRQDHMDAIRGVIDAVNCVFFSDHICMTRAGGIEIGQLTTLPHTEEAADVFCRNVDTVRAQLGSMPLMFENITNRFLVQHSTLSEPDFINRITRRTGAGLLIDLTNIYTNATNFGFDAKAWIDAVDPASITGVHLAGGEWEDGHLYDTHSRAVPPEVWELYQYLLTKGTPQATIVEWDQDAPPVAELMREVETATSYLRQSRAASAATLPPPARQFQEERAYAP